MAIAYGSAILLSGRCAATSAPFHAGEEHKLSMAATSGVGISSPPQRGGPKDGRDAWLAPASGSAKPRRSGGAP
jgi:hypothetical protein